MNGQYLHPPKVRSATAALSKRPHRIHLILSFTLILALTIFSSGCSDEPDVRTPENLNIGVLPDESTKRLIARHGGLAKYLADTLGVTHTLVIPKDYNDLLRQFKEGKIDLAYFGGVTFVQAHTEGKAIPIAMRVIDSRFTSSFLVRADTRLETLGDFQGRTFAFGSRLSTSGHLMPRHFLNKKGITPEAFFSDIAYSGAHDKTVEWVRDGKVEIGVANSLVVNRMFQDGRLSRDTIRVLWKTPPYADYVWAAQSDLAPRFLNRLRDAFLSLSSANTDHVSVLEKANADSFLPASIRDFSELKQTIETNTRRLAGY